METITKLMKGNEAMAEAAILAKCDAYFGYPITPQSEVLEYLSREMPKRYGFALQAESEVAAINMIYGSAGAGGRIMTSSSSPGISLMQEGLSYMASAEIPCLVVNVNRAGPGLGTIQPAQGDYFQAVKGGGHGDYNLIVLAPSSVQEMADFVFLGFELADKYRTPVMMLADGAIGQMMEKVTFTNKEIVKINKPWATVGKPKTRERNFLTSLHIQPEKMERHNIHLQEKFALIAEKETRWEEIMVDDAEFVFVAFGLAARVCHKAIQLARAKGIKAGLLRPITLWPFPSKRLDELSKKTKLFITVELNAGQMVQDVKLAVLGKAPVEFYGRMGGMIPTPEEIFSIFENFITKYHVN
ncbi:MAG TPA: 3-methyl-2-oxobutanoate dehydrogenase subunit VorB [Ignavibacteria bacterium]|nr:3-methyl-2-oxobutanoate dehydrogenase subunit VorB [Ignavibacteria bacterium]